MVPWTNVHPLVGMGIFLIGGVVMVEQAKIVLEFLGVFLVVYFGTYLFSFKKIKKFNRNKMAVNIKYLVIKYNIDVVKLGYKRVFKNLMLVIHLL